MMHNLFPRMSEHQVMLTSRSLLMSVFFVSLFLIHNDRVALIFLFIIKNLLRMVVYFYRIFFHHPRITRLHPPPHKFNFRYCANCKFIYARVSRFYRVLARDRKNVENLCKKKPKNLVFILLIYIFVVLKNGMHIFLEFRRKLIFFVKLEQVIKVII